MDAFFLKASQAMRLKICIGGHFQEDEAYFESWQTAKRN